MSDFGYDDRNPRVMREARVLLNVYHTAAERNSAADKGKWDKKHEAGKKLLAWAKTGETEAPAKGEVRVSVPERPADWRKPMKVE